MSFLSRLLEFFRKKLLGLISESSSALDGCSAVHDPFVLRFVWYNSQTQKCLCNFHLIPIPGLDKVTTKDEVKVERNAPNMHIPHKTADREKMQREAGELQKMIGSDTDGEKQKHIFSTSFHGNNTAKGSTIFERKPISYLVMAYNDTNHTNKCLTSGNIFPQFSKNNPKVAKYCFKFDSADKAESWRKAFDLCILYISIIIVMVFN